MRKRLALAAILVIALSASGFAFAQAVNAPTSFDRFMWTATGGASQSVAFGSNGTPLATPRVPSISLDGGLPRVSAGGILSTVGESKIAVEATARISGLEVGKAVGRAAGKLIMPVAVGSALYDLAKELGLSWKSPEKLTKILMNLSPRPSIMVCGIPRSARHAARWLRGYLVLATSTA